LGHTLDTTGLALERAGFFGGGGWWIPLLEKLGMTRPEALTVLAALTDLLHGAKGTHTIWLAFTSVLHDPEATKIAGIDVKSTVEIAEFAEWRAEIHSRLRSLGGASDHTHRLITAMAAVGQTIDDRALFTLMVQGWIECRNDPELASENDMEADSLSEAIQVASAHVAEGRRDRGAPLIRARELARADAKTKAYDRNRTKGAGPTLTRPAAHANRRPPPAAMGKKALKPAYVPVKARATSKRAKAKPKGTIRAKGSSSATATDRAAATDIARDTVIAALPPGANSRAARALAREHSKRKADEDTLEDSPGQHKRQEQGNCTGEKRQGDDMTPAGAAKEARLDRRTQQKRPQEGTAAEDSPDTTPRQRQRRDRLSQQKRAADDLSDGEVQRHRHRSEESRMQSRARDEQEEDNNGTKRKKTSNTEAATGTSEQEPD
jgi:hypothetical protein